MAYLGSWKIDDLLTFYANTQVFATGVATDADSAPTYRVYEDETGTPLLTGSMALLDSSNTAGFYSEQITLSAANGFEKGKCYAIYIAATVSSVAGAKHDTFQIEAEVDANTVSPTVSANVTQISGDSGAADNCETAFDGGSFNVGGGGVVAASVTGAVGSVTGNVGGNVAGSVGSVTARVTANTDQLAGQTVTAAAGVTFPTSVASPTNITAGTITTVTNLTNAPTNGDFTATMKTSIGTAVAASAVASVTGNVGGNVAGSVGSVVGNVGGDLVGDVQGNVVGDVQGNVDGSVDSVTQQVNANIAQINGTTVLGDGAGTPWGP